VTYPSLFTWAHHLPTTVRCRRTACPRLPYVIALGEHHPPAGPPGYRCVVLVNTPDWFPPDAGYYGYQPRLEPFPGTRPGYNLPTTLRVTPLQACRAFPSVTVRRSLQFLDSGRYRFPTVPFGRPATNVCSWALGPYRLTTVGNRLFEPFVHRFVCCLFPRAPGLCVLLHYRHLITTNTTTVDPGG